MGGKSTKRERFLPHICQLRSCFHHIVTHFPQNATEIIRFLKTSQNCFFFKNRF